jgi:hypothetical protein
MTGCGGSLRGDRVGLVVRRWRGHDRERLYVNDADTKEGVGYYDYQTGKLVVKDEERSYEVLETLRPFLGSEVPEALGAPIVGPPFSRGNDLMHNKAGQAAAARAARPRPRGLQAVAARIMRTRTQAASREVGAKGEQFVGKRLGRLKNDGWHVLPAVARRGGADIDHLVIGSPGVFTVNTKHHRGARIWVGDDVVKVDDVSQPYLRDSRHEAESAARVLSEAAGLDVRVTPVLAFVGAHSVQYGSGRGGVIVARGEDVDQVLRELPAVYSFQERERILAVARRAEIWAA